MTETSDGFDRAIACRYCGCSIGKEFCGQCGLQFEVFAPRSVERYVLNRITILLNSIPRFLITSAVLFCRPILFFTLLHENYGRMYQIRIFYPLHRDAPYSHRRRPTSPENFLLFSIILVSATNIFSGVGDITLLHNAVQLLPDHLQEYTSQTIVSLVIEGIFVVAAFFFFHLSRLLLKVGPSTGYSEYFLYSFGQMLFLYVVIFSFAPVLDSYTVGWSPFEPLARSIGAVLILFPIVFYWLIIPWYVFPKCYSIRRARIWLAFFTFPVTPVALLLALTVLLMDIQLD